MSFLQKLFGRSETHPRDALQPFYAQLVATARQPHWYLDGGVADSVDGRFDMLATLLSLALLRLEGERTYAGASALLTEVFVDDMDAQMREFGVGDVVVGKRVGKLMGLLGGRLGALRAALADGGDLDGFIQRNLYRAETRDPANTAHVANALRRHYTQLLAADSNAIVAGDASW
jgi:cytochrome b pre-mRNA-processing protein 3